MMLSATATTTLSITPLSATATTTTTTTSAPHQHLSQHHNAIDPRASRSFLSSTIHSKRILCLLRA